MAILIALSLIILALTLITFLALVAGVRYTDRRKSLRDGSAGGVAAALARKVLGVYVRQPEDRGCRETETNCDCRVRR
jgi:hypothetical protein